LERLEALLLADLVKVGVDSDASEYQPGRMSRVCVHENTHGIARRSSTVRSPEREAGREPRLRFSTTEMGVACPK